MHIVTMFIAEDLHLDMPWSFDVFFNQHMLVTKTLHSFSPGGIELLEEFGFRVDYSHTFATSAKGCFEHDWEANFMCFFQEELIILIVSVVAFDNWNIRILHYKFRLTFGAHLLNSRGRWTNEFDVVLL